MSSRNRSADSGGRDHGRARAGLIRVPGEPSLRSSRTWRRSTRTSGHSSDEARRSAPPGFTRLSSPDATRRPRRWTTRAAPSARSWRTSSVAGSLRGEPRGQPCPHGAEPRRLDRGRPIRILSPPRSGLGQGIRTQGASRARTGSETPGRGGSREEFMKGEPGLGMACVEWIHEHEIAAVASDNWAIEVLPGEYPDQVSTCTWSSFAIWG